MIGKYLYEATTWLNMYQNSTIFAAFSGGSDSAVATDIYVRWCRSHNRQPRIMCIDTGLSADTWRDDVIAACRNHWNVEPEFFFGAGWDWYEENVLDYGFAYTPSQHSIYYRMLKERAIDKAVRENKRKRKDRVVFVTGVRRAESARRARTPYHYRRGARVTLNAICEFTREQRDAYLRALLPDWTIEKKSSDCYCNWTRNDTVETIRSHSPRLAEKIEALECEATANGLWRYGERPQKRQSQVRSKDDMPEDSLCINCNNVSRGV